MQVRQYYSDDYAGLESGNLIFYYGYELEDLESGDWCFNVKRHGLEIYRLTSTQIERSMVSNYLVQLDSPRDYLLAGIGIWLLVK